jgi:SAM-dependent methyltransferase
MLFTAVGLEQATDEHVARYKACRFRTGSLVIDLCCGIGGDFAALAGRGPAIGIDLSPALAYVARENSRLATPGAEVLCAAADAGHCNVIDADAWHIDPDRRPSPGRRTVDLRRSRPGADVIKALLTQNLQAAVKLAPAARLPEAWHDSAELEWISRGRECRQLVAWHGRLATHPGMRRATQISNSGMPATFFGQANVPLAILPGHRPFRFLFDPDPALSASALVGALAEQRNLHALGPGIAYLAGDTLVADPLLDAFEVDDALPFDLKRLRAVVRERRIGDLEVKKRGVDADPEVVREQLSPSGDQRATLLLARRGSRVMAWLARRVVRTELAIDEIHPQA